MKLSVSHKTIYTMEKQQSASDIEVDEIEVDEIEVDEIEVDEIHEIDPRIVDIYGAAQDECNVDGITPEEIRAILNKYANKICELGGDDKCVINFGQAAHLDQVFFGKSGGFWRTAYNLVYEGDVVDDCVVGQCGLLTMDFASIEDNDSGYASEQERDDIENKIDPVIIFMNKLY